MKWRALSLSQPYASAIAVGPKRIENRSTPIARNVAPCWVGLHAAKSTVDVDPVAWDIRWPEGVFQKFPSGVLLGAMFIDWVHPYPPITVHGRGADPKDIALQEDPWAFGPWCLHIAEVRRLPEPRPCRGMLGLWAVPAVLAVELDLLVPGVAR